MLKRRKGAQPVRMPSIGAHVPAEFVFEAARTLAALGHATIDASTDLTTIGWDDLANDLNQWTSIYGSLVAQLLAETVNRDGGTIML